jgi:hypothetical protein
VSITNYSIKPILDMIGIELIIEKEVISASLPNGSIQILAHKVLGKKPNITELKFTGYKKETNEIITWFSKEELKLGDEFTIRVVDVLKNSNPIEIKPMISTEKIIEHKLRSYKALKKELESLDLI